MKINKNLHILVLLLLLYSCIGGKNTDTRLSQIDSLISKHLYDSAYSIISQIDTIVYGDKNKAFYFILKNHILYRLDKSVESNTTIFRSIDYYKSVGDKENLARAYIVKGEMSNDNKEATKFFKKAESLLNDIENLEIHCQTYAHLSFLNHMTGNYNKALKYGKKALECAKKTNNKHWIGYSLDNLGVIYYKMNLQNEYLIYLKQIEPYIPFQPKKSQASMLDNLSSFFKHSGQYDKAEAYLKKSLEIYPMDRTYGLLAELYAEQGKTADIDTLWKKALHSENLLTRQYTLRPYAKWLYKQKLYKEAWEIAMQIPNVTDSLYQDWQTETIKEAQDSYDRQITNIKYRNTLRLVLIGTALLACIFIIVWLYYHLKTQKAKNRLAENQIMITDYTARIGELEKDGKAQSKEVRELKRKLDTLRGKQTETLYKGKRKYEDIVSGGTAVTWHKSDYNDVVEYYRSVNMPFVLSLENEYKSLTAGNKFYLLLSEELKFGDNDICRIMGLTDGALRTMRSRIKNKSGFERS